MSKAFKCDRCKLCFDPKEVGANSYFLTMKEYFTQNGYEYMDYKIGYKEEDVHLCPGCAKDFMFFMDGKFDEGKEVEIADAYYQKGYEDGIKECMRASDITVSSFDTSDSVIIRGNCAECDSKTAERKKCTKKKSEH